MLDLCTGALFEGEAIGAKRYSVAAHARAVALKDRHMEGQALLLRSRADIMICDLSSGLEAASRAAELLADSERGLYVYAQSIRSYAASSMGEVGLATQVMRDALKLQSGPSCSGWESALCHNYDGLVSMWGGDLEGADDSFDAALWFADLSKSFQPLANRLFLAVMEALRHENEAREKGSPLVPDLTNLFALLGQIRRLLASGNCDVLVDRGSMTMGLAIMELANVFALVRVGQLEEAVLHYHLCKQVLQKLPSTNWFHGLLQWAKHDIYRARNMLQEAAAAKAVMARIAKGSQHAQLLKLANAL